MYFSLLKVILAIRPEGRRLRFSPAILSGAFGFIILKNMVHGNRMIALKLWLESGEVKRFTDIFCLVPKVHFARFVGISHKRIQNVVKGKASFTAPELLKISIFLQVEFRIIEKLFNNTAD